MSEKWTYSFIFALLLFSFLFSFIGIHNIFGAGHDRAFLKVIVLVNNTDGGTAKPSDFEIIIGDLINKPAVPDRFYGSSKGSIILIVPGTHEISFNSIIINDVTYSPEFSGNCINKGLTSGEVTIKPGDKKTCIINLIYPNF